MESNNTKPNMLLRGELLNESGNLNECGYATSLVKEYDRDKITARKNRIKEWDYYCVSDENFALALTIADNSYMGMASASMMNFNSFQFKTTSQIKFNTKGQVGLPSTSEAGDTVWEDKRVNISFLNDGKTRKLVGHFDKFYKKDSLEFDVELTDEPRDSIVVAVPFHKDKHFYYNQKIVGLKASGTVSVGGKEKKFSDSALGIFDWGRGVWTRKNTWYWAAACGYGADGIKLGLNLGYGFGQNTATENAFFIDGVLHKLGKVTFSIPINFKNKEEYLKPWSIKDEEGRLSLTFYPKINRKDKASFLWIKSNQNQVFGNFVGWCIDDNGAKVEIKALTGFAEKVMNCW